MASSRHNEANMVRIGQIARLVLVCLFAGMVAVGYLWQKNEIDQLGREIRAREIKLERLRRANEQYRNELAELQSPQYLDFRVRQLELGLVEPAESQILRLYEAPASEGSLSVDGRLVKRSFGSRRTGRPNPQ